MLKPKAYMLMESGQGRIITDSEGYPRRFESKPSHETLREWESMVERAIGVKTKLYPTAFVDGKYVAKIVI